MSLALALVTEFMMWWEKVYMLSKVTPSNFGVWSSLADFPFSLDLDFGMDLELVGVGVNRVTVDFSLKANKFITKESA